MVSKTYFTIGRDAKTGVFVERKAGRGANTQVMNSKVFEKAAGKADAKFRELSSNRERSVTIKNGRGEVIYKHGKKK